MASGDAIRKAISRAVKELEDEDKKESLTTNNLLKYPPDMDKVNSFVIRLNTSFHNGDSVQNQIAIAKFILAESGCKAVVILRVCEVSEGGIFRIYFREKTPCRTPETYTLDDFPCVQAVINKRQEVVATDEDNQALTVLVGWKPLFTFIPDVVVAIPIFQLNQKVTAIVAMSFKKAIPKEFMTKKFPVFKEILESVTPYAMMLQATRDFQEDTKSIQYVIQSIEAINGDVNKRFPDKCAIKIATELIKLTGCRTASVYQLDTVDQEFSRLFSTGGYRKYSAGSRNCPNPRCHGIETFPYCSDKEPLGWVAVNRRILKINNASECADYNLPKVALHNSLYCICKNVLCVPINDLSGESTVVIELTDKKGGFTQRDVEMSELFAQNASCSYTCAVMLTHREKNNRRDSMLGQILLNVEPVKHAKVEQILSQLRKVNPTEFEGLFLEFSFSLKSFPEWKMVGWILHAFNDLDLSNIFKIRKTTLIRFIVAAQQGYRHLTYHNWEHACSVAHFGYCMIKNLKLLQDGYMTPLEAFALLVSGLVHDIDHRGTNNRFQSCTNSDLFQLYNTQESVLERHHLAIALAILRREDCNILENLTPEDYKEFVELLTWNILATDIAKYLQTRDTNFALLRNLGKTKREDKLALFSLMMTASDVNDSVKPWDDFLVSVSNILSEFFEQGELEKELGLCPMPMMDMNQAYIPEVEYKFISGIVLPVFKTFATRFPSMKPLQETLERYCENWEYSTLIFDAHFDDEDQLKILSLPEMTETNLRKLAENNASNVRRFSAGQSSAPTQRTTVVLSRSFVSNRDLLAVPSATTDIRPEEEFRKMFENTSTFDDVNPEDLIEPEIYTKEEGPKFCGCFGKKRAKDKTKESFKMYIQNKNQNL